MQASALAHPNIALVKYWGKRNVVKNLPAVGSLSVTLDTLHTRMTVEFRADGEDSLVVNGAEAPGMVDRVMRCLDQVVGLDRLPAVVTSEGNFP
ncbi:MAG: diphosphomevalonate decarboxylase, partial [Pseudomonadota bacterium]|nr:diphosphomevalonate decarboxylase [Pseudomonadota bacterium]